MVCSTCSRSFDGYARFCSGCGQPLNQPVQVREPLKRLRYGRMVAGVCAGFAQAYNVDVTLLRLAVCAAAFLSGGTLTLAYIIAWIVMPVAPYALPTEATSTPVP